MPIAVDTFIHRIAESKLLGYADLVQFVDSLAPHEHPQSAKQLAELLIRDGRLTAYQFDQICCGTHRNLVLGNYAILEKLGHGGMGLVFKAEHRLMKRHVALKLLAPHMTSSLATRKRFEQEIEAAGRLRHPNIVAADDADESDGVRFLVMEYVEGITLAKLVHQQGPLSTMQAVRCALDVARGMKYAHGEGVTHRDIKPSNLLIDRSGTVKILDLGLARVESRRWSQPESPALGEEVIGTADYMAPEQTLELTRADHRSDIYSLGITLWFLLSGRPPFQKESITDKMRAHQVQPLPPLVNLRSDLPAELDRVIATMAAKAPENRYQSMAEVVSSLEDCLALIEQRDGNAELDFYPQRTLPSQQSSAFEHAAMSLTSSLDQTASYGRPLANSHSASFLANREIRTDTTIVPEDITAIQPIATLIGPVVPPQFGTPLKRPSKIRGALAKSQEHRHSITLAASIAIAMIGWGAISNVEQPAERIPPSGIPAPRVTASSGSASRTGATRETSPNDRRDSLASDQRTTADISTGQPLQVTTANGLTTTDTSLRSSPPPSAVAPFDSEQAKALQGQWAEFLNIPVEWTGPYGIVFRLIPPGSFLMGTNANELDNLEKLRPNRRMAALRLLMLQSETPQRLVTVDQPFYLSTTELTYEQFARYVCNSGAITDAEREGYGVRNGIRGENLGEPGKSWRSLSQHTHRPVGYLSWNDAVACCEFLSRKSRGEFRLPTEAEWEYACRAGTNTRFHYGDEIHSSANSRGPLADRDAPILPPNAFGLWNMYSGVSELCVDEFSIGDAVLTEELVPIFGSETNLIDVAARFRIVRGIVNGETALRSRSSARGASLPTMRHRYQGVRVAASIDSVIETTLAGSSLAAQSQNSPQGMKRP